ncbi:MAG: hypothetical protein U0165_02525 [Polyangiaceae bacterium]
MCGRGCGSDGSVVSEAGECCVRFDLLDVMMPVLDGLETARAVCAKLERFDVRP